MNLHENLHDYNCPWHSYKMHFFSCNESAALNHGRLITNVYTKKNLYSPIVNTSLVDEITQTGVINTSGSTKRQSKVR